jgi:hypothetical protein
MITQLQRHFATEATHSAVENVLIVLESKDYGVTHIHTHMHTHMHTHTHAHTHTHTHTHTHRHTQTHTLWQVMFNSRIFDLESKIAEFYVQVPARPFVFHCCYTAVALWLHCCYTVLRRLYVHACVCVCVCVWLDVH